MNVLVSHESSIYKLILDQLPLGHKYNFMTDIDVDTIEGHLVWDARGLDSNDKKDDMKSKIEECCLIEKIEVIDTSPYLVPWLEDTFPDKFVFHMGGEYPILLPSFMICSMGEKKTHINSVSNVCWNPKHDIEMWNYLKYIGINDLNIALSMYGDVNVHFVKNLRKKLDDNEMKVLSINAIFFNRRENFNENFGLFIIHFRKMIEFASILGAKYIIYGSSSSKFINTNVFENYVNIQKAKCYFTHAMNSICDIAEKYKIGIILKPNTDSNFLKTNDEVFEIVKEINRENLYVGSSRNSQIISHGLFNIAEFNGERLFNSTTSIQRFIAFILDSVMNSPTDIDNSE